MSITFGFAIYFVLWWIVFFVMLPLGVQTQDEAGDVVPGSASSAPVNPKIGRKVLWTTLLSAAIFASVYGLAYFNIVDLNAILFGR